MALCIDASEPSNALSSTSIQTGPVYLISVSAVKNDSIHIAKAGKLWW